MMDVTVVMLFQPSNSCMTKTSLMRPAQSTEPEAMTMDRNALPSNTAETATHQAPASSLIPTMSTTLISLDPLLERKT
jgi:hypothetical protein